jgi:hypothetical protein
MSSNPKGKRKLFGKYNRKREPIQISEDGTARIPLTKGMYALVDAEDVPVLSQYNWYAAPRGTTTYAATRLRDEKQTHVYMHQMLLKVPADKMVDHINRNGLDDRKSNLREVDRVFNGLNRGQQRNARTSGHKGVSFEASRGKWRAELQVHGKKVSKRFNTEVEAATWYSEQFNEHTTSLHTGI